MGRQKVDQRQLFYLFNLEGRIPTHHPLRRINPVVTRITQIPVWDKSAREDGTFSRSGFTFDRERNIYICPAGKVLKTTGNVGNDHILRYLAPKLELDSWFGVVVPARTLQETVAQLVAWFTTALQEPVIKAKLAVQGLYPVGACGAAYTALLRKQYDDFGRTISETNIKAE